MTRCNPLSPPERTGILKRAANRYRNHLLSSMSAVAFGCSASAALAQTLPTGGQVQAGTATIASGGAGKLQVSQASGKAIIDWQSFSIGAGGEVRIDNGAGATLNRVTGQSLSAIDGVLSATGSVYLLNPNGVVIGKSGVVNTGGNFLASTGRISNEEFLAGGTLNIGNMSSAKVVSQTVRLRESIAMMRDLRRLVSDTIESVADPLLVTDLDDAIVLANRPTAALSGKPLVGLRAAALLGEISGVPVSPDALPDELNVGERVFSLRRSPLRDSNGAQRGWILQLLELTAVRAAENEREAALQFLSHDMRSPQSSIISLLEQYRDAIDHPDLADRITGLAWRTLTLADNFVQLARVEAAAFNPEEIDFGEVLTEAADDLWSQASKRDVRIALDGIDQPHYLLAERDTLRRALVNLIDNAVKFSPEGGAVRCTVATVDDGRFVECVIADEGPGMSAERRANPFRRYGAHQAAPGSRYSVGLGLAYVGAAVARHGTRFTLRFPALA